MEVVLHQAKFNSLFGLACSLITLSGYSHASIIDNQGQRWDTTLCRGCFGKAPPLSDEPNREITVISLPELDPSDFIKFNLGRRYDTLGLLLWPWRKQNPDRWYCFEAVLCCLNAVGLNLKLGKKISGDSLLSALLSKGYVANTTKGKYYESPHHPT